MIVWSKSLLEKASKRNCGTKGLLAVIGTALAVSAAVSVVIYKLTSHSSKKAAANVDLDDFCEFDDDFDYSYDEDEVI